MTQVRTKPTINVSVSQEVLDMMNEMAREDAPAGYRPDRSRLIAALVTAEHRRRAEIKAADLKEEKRVEKKGRKP